MADAQPHVAAAVKNDVTSVRTAETVRSALALAWTLACAAATALLVASPAIAQLLFGWGRMDAAGLDHYEISNFGMPGHWSRHNTSYWQGVHYLGIGPSAHSYNGHARRWNVANNARYIKGITEGTTYWEEESLTAAQRTNEALLARLWDHLTGLLRELAVRIAPPEAYRAAGVDYNAVLQGAQATLARRADGRAVVLLLPGVRRGGVASDQSGAARLFRRGARLLFRAGGGGRGTGLHRGQSRSGHKVDRRTGRSGGGAACRAPVRAG